MSFILDHPALILQEACQAQKSSSFQPVNMA